MTDAFDLSLALIRWLQGFSPALDGPMRLITRLGDGEFYLLLLPLLYWLLSPALGLRLLVLLIATDALTSALKLSLGQPRPSWLGTVRGIELAGGYGLPSGHASNAVAVWGGLARQVGRRWAWLTGGVVIGLIGLSRLYLGVHFLHDVLAGWLVGLLALLLGDAIARRFGPTLTAAQPGTWLALGVLGGLAVVGLGGLAGLIAAGRVDPVAWASFSEQARGLGGFTTGGGALAGGLIGYGLMRRYAPFDVGGSWARRITRVLLGLAGLLLVWRGLAVGFAMLAPDGTPLGDWLRFVRYLSVTVWGTAGAPWLWRRLGLTRSA